MPKIVSIEPEKPSKKMSEQAIGQFLETMRNQAFADEIETLKNEISVALDSAVKQILTKIEVEVDSEKQIQKIVKSIESLKAGVEKIPAPKINMDSDFKSTRNEIKKSADMLASKIADLAFIGDNSRDISSLKSAIDNVASQVKSSLDQAAQKKPKLSFSIDVTDRDAIGRISSVKIRQI